MSKTNKLLILGCAVITIIICLVFVCNTNQISNIIDVLNNRNPNPTLTTAQLDNQTITYIHEGRDFDYIKSHSNISEEELVNLLAIKFNLNPKDVPYINLKKCLEN